MPSLQDLTWLVFRDVNRTLGGHASMELLRRTLGARGWLTDEEHALLVAVSRLTPGTNILAYCVALGWQVARWDGALVSLAAASAPASVVIALLSATLVQVDQLPIVRMAIAVALIVAAVLVLSTAWQLLRPYVKETNAMRTASSPPSSWDWWWRVDADTRPVCRGYLGVVMGPPDPPLVTPEDR